MMRMALLTLVAVVCSACANTAPPRDARLVGDPPEGIRIRTKTTDGTEPKQLGPSLQIVRERLRPCLPGSEGKVNVVLTRRDDVVHLSFAPDASLDPRTRDCVLETLSTVDLEDVGNNVGGTSIPPTGYTSVIQVSW